MNPINQLNQQVKPELLSPAGDLERLKVAFEHGADAVYLGGSNYLGLRAAAKNFDHQELGEAIEYAHGRSKKVYLTLNSFLHDEDFVALAEYAPIVARQGVDAVIVSDLGVLRWLQTNLPELEVHLSTQASCLNGASASFWRQMGVKRVVVGRELSILQTGNVAREAGVEVEMFVHGSLCMSYSGHCTISNYTSGRDSNRGGCAHSCRHEYTLNNGEKNQSSFFMSSKDLLGIEHIPAFFEQKIHSLKIEGRMKGHLYCAVVTKVYRLLIDHYALYGKLPEGLLKEARHELSALVNRGYTEANFEQKADSSSIAHNQSYEEEHPMAALVVAAHPKKGLILHVRSSFSPEDNLEIIAKSSMGGIKLSMSEMRGLQGERIEKTKPSTLIHLPFIEGVGELQVVRRIHS